MADEVDLRTCFSCGNPLAVGSRDKNRPVDKFRTFVIKPPSHHGEQKLYPVIFERVVCQADNLPTGGSSIEDTVFLCERCLAKQGKGFRKNMADIFLAKLRSRSANLIAKFFNLNIVPIGPSSAARLKELRTESIAGILSVLQRERKDEIVPELILALFESGVIIFDVHAKKIFESLDAVSAEYMADSLNALLLDMGTVLSSPEIESLMRKLTSLEAFLFASDD